MTPDIERETVALARRLAALGESERSAGRSTSWWSERVMDWAMARPAFKTQLFRFVDVFPALSDEGDVARHIGEYFAGTGIPRVLRSGIGVADRLTLGSRLEARIARRNIGRMARQFIVGTTPAEAYFVVCDRTTMTQNDLDNGRLVCLVGVSPLRPAEFVIFRIGQKTLEAARR